MDSKTLLQQLSQQKYTLHCDNGELRGNAVQLLEDVVRQSQFFIIGEEHGIAEIPRITEALFRLCVTHGYRYFCAEIGTLMAEKITGIAHSDGFSGLEAFIKADPLAVPFYNCREDMELLNAIFQHSPDEQKPLWGIDQEYMFSIEILLAEVLKNTDDEATHVLVNQLLQQATTLRQEGIPSMFVLYNADLSPIRTANSANTAVLRIINELEASFKIYLHYFRAIQGEPEYSYYNNLEREQLMKSKFISHYHHARQQASQPRVLLRFGETHGSRGLSPTKVYSLTNFIAELATTNDAEIFNILMIAGTGTQTRSAEGINNADFANREWMQPLMDIAGREGWTLLDFRPLRPIISTHRIDDLPAQLEDLFWRYDTLLILNGSNPSNPFS